MYVFVFSKKKKKTADSVFGDSRYITLRGAKKNPYWVYARLPRKRKRCSKLKYTDKV